MATESSIRYPYSAILAHALRPGEELPQDKTMALRLGVSERQTRKARMSPDGTIDAYLADAMCTGMGMHPNNVVGFEGWIDVDSDILEAEAVAAEARAARKAKGELRVS